MPPEAATASLGGVEDTGKKIAGRDAIDNLKFENCLDVRHAPEGFIARYLGTTCHAQEKRDFLLGEAAPLALHPQVILQSMFCHKKFCGFQFDDGSILGEARGRFKDGKTCRRRQVFYGAFGL